MINQPEIRSFLDTDLYKFTMQAAVNRFYPDAVASYEFTNRTIQNTFTRPAVDWIQEQVNSLAELRFSKDEIAYLREAVPQLPDDYYTLLNEFKLDPNNELTIEFDESSGHLNIYIQGLWKVTILYEIPVLALISAAYFKFVDTNWTSDGQFDRAKSKGLKLLHGKCHFADFGTRRRRSFEIQDTVIQGLIAAQRDYVAELKLKPDTPPSEKGILTGTSNVHFARKYGLKPIGTVAHEWTMGIAAITGDYVNANKLALEQWLQMYGSKYAGVALTDTFGTKSFLKCFLPPLSDMYAGVRHDSGDPIEYTKLISEYYRKLGYSPGSKAIVYSDSLNEEKCIKYREAALSHGLVPSFGIGTHFTNDFTDSKPLNIVIKISAINGKPAIKLSDHPDKHSGDLDTVCKVKEILGYTEQSWAEGDETQRW
ncbi:hypothetical protein CANCADRAFT_108275 [Tortispora caseinolytica NRRL Y-17796]|uniref:Nicotinate phosphoribosyltransferase n=1 Tax=Tortispora caseinolytica NRRL Y-17796 TaxID=767744 RepID=A0A1E4TFR2_9ASCO|nr:hypothetical protein CANCADRAFT_108275 [Tortispora caseinolytica NRRL Y-17796]